MLLCVVPEFRGTLQNEEKIKFGYWLYAENKGCWDVPLAAQPWQSLCCLLLPSSHWQPCPAPAPWKDLQLPQLVTVSHILKTFMFAMIFPAILFALYTVTSSWDILNLSSLKMYCHCSTSATIRFDSGRDHPEVLFCEQWTAYDNCSSDHISLQDSCASFSVVLLTLLPHFNPHHGFSPLGFLAQAQFPWLGYSTTALPIALAPTPSRLSSAFWFLFLQHSVHCISL